MKTALFAGWKARFYSVCMLMLFSALMVGGMGSAHAQSTPQDHRTAAIGAAGHPAGRRRRSRTGG